MRVALAVALLTPIIAALATPAAAAGKPELAGLWNCQSPAGPALLDFRTRDQLTYGGLERRYMVSGNVIRVIEDGFPVDYRFQLGSDNLRIVTPDGDPITCVRSAAATPSTPPGGAPQAGARGGLNHLLQGQMCSYSGSTSSTGSYARTEKVYFDGRGSFGTGSESSFNTNHADAGGNSTGTGIGYGSGEGPAGSYEVTAVQVGAPIRVRWANGEDDVAYVNFVVDGRISEVRYGKKVFGLALCNL